MAKSTDNIGGDQPQGSFLATGGEQEDPDAPPDNYYNPVDAGFADPGYDQCCDPTYDPTAYSPAPTAQI
jgi:hypothetical protein